MIHMRLRDNAFLHILSGKKDIEMRLYDEKRREVRIGDEIEFENTQNHQKMLAIVKNLHVFPSFSELYGAFDKERIGYLPHENADPDDMLEYYSASDIEKWGVLGIEIELIDPAENG